MATALLSHFRPRRFLGGSYHCVSMLRRLDHTHRSDQWSEPGVSRHVAINFPASAHIAIASSPHVRQGRGTARDLRRKAALCACGLGAGATTRLFCARPKTQSRRRLVPGGAPRRQPQNSHRAGSSLDSLLEQAGFELVWGFPRQVVFFGLLPVLCSERGGAFFVPSPAIRFPERAEGVKGSKR